MSQVLYCPKAGKPKEKKSKMPWVRTASDIKIRVLVKLKKKCSKLH